MSYISKQRQIAEGIAAVLAGITIPGVSLALAVDTELKDFRNISRLPALQLAAGPTDGHNLTMRGRRERTAMFGVWVLAEGPSSQAQVMDACGQVANRVEKKDPATDSFLGIPHSSVEIIDAFVPNVQPFETSEEISQGKRKWLVEVGVKFAHLRGEA